MYTFGFVLMTPQLYINYKVRYRISRKVFADACLRSIEEGPPTIPMTSCYLFPAQASKCNREQYCSHSPILGKSTAARGTKFKINRIPVTKPRSHARPPSTFRASMCWLQLKSVAHLPWRFLCYRSLNTVIDDLFAFVIRMPTMHRLVR